MPRGSRHVKLIQNYIDGKFVSSKSRFLDINPADGSVIAEVSEADRDQVDAAVHSARQALRGEWGRSSIRERAASLHRLAGEIEKRFECFVAAEVADTGKPITLASKLDVPRAAANFRVFADLIKTAGLESFQTETPDGNSAVNYAVRKPLGVIGIITPWNLPLLLLTWKLAPSLACGNTVVVKPSEETPATAALLADVIKEAGIPDGVYNVVQGFGPDSAGEFLTQHPSVNAVTFTGESATGAAIMKTVAASVKPVSFELGGKNAAIVFDDCDFEETVRGISDAAFLNTGQVCLCAERVYVQRGIFDRFVSALKHKAEGLRLGFPTEESTELGPLISSQHRKKVLDYYQLAKSEGANTVTGGGVPEFVNRLDQGFYIQPTIYTGLAESARCMKEEIFGPVCHVTPFDSEDEAVSFANDTQYGLAASIWTSNLKRGHRIAQRMNVGITWVNCWFLRDLRTPFGGIGLSGIGREGGMHSLNFYSELNNICIRL
ncbi:MAG TPA: 2-hydroxymuconic semialdehyde dehydrogenase [Candidatus Sulfotelmatobacter sp.]|nr:2-hydroxymuconic semialdehyde dehydrogenase [Candidatus Sulfotelmatobacter sp.]